MKSENQNRENRFRSLSDLASKIGWSDSFENRENRSSKLSDLASKIGWSEDKLSMANWLDENAPEEIKIFLAVMTKAPIFPVLLLSSYEN